MEVEPVGEVELSEIRRKLEESQNRLVHGFWSVCTRKREVSLAI